MITQMEVRWRFYEQQDRAFNRKDEIQQGKVMSLCVHCLRGMEPENRQMKRVFFQGWCAVGVGSICTGADIFVTHRQDLLWVMCLFVYERASERENRRFGPSVCIAP